MRKVLVLVVSMALALVLCSGVALAQIIIGTDGTDNLVGTNSADQITGKGGNDSLAGRAGNDTYSFDDNFGTDTLTETATVGARKLPGGTDTLNFSQYSSGPLAISMIPQWNGSNNRAYDETNLTPSVALGSSPVENAVGGSGSDNIYGGSARNTYKGGPGGNDLLFDYGGCGPCGPTALAASDDTYKGFTSGTGTDYVGDFAGTADRLDLRPLESSDVYFDAFDQNGDGTNDSLRIVINDSTRVDVYGYFSPALGGQQNGRMEQIIFSNETVTSAASMM